VKIACLLGALHETMHTSLESLKGNTPDGPNLRAAWHEHMEKNPPRYREQFFEDVIKKADQAIHHLCTYFLGLIAC
jgi:hypothetical protein